MKNILLIILLLVTVSCQNTKAQSVFKTGHIIEIVDGLTPAQFIVDMNANFDTINIASNGATLTTLTPSNYLAAINSNMTALNSIAINSITLLPMVVGSGKTFLNNLNTNMNNLYDEFIAEAVRTNFLYISNSGNDNTGDGSLSKPYLTLSKASIVLTDNTRILLAKGSTFINDKLTLSNKKHIDVNSYGTGAKPILTGLKSVTSWTNEGGNIWSKQDNNLPIEVTNVFISGTKATLGRSATDYVATGGSYNTLVDASLTDADGYWNNAELFISTEPWIRLPYRVNSYASKTFNFTAIDTTYIVIGRTQFQVLAGNHFVIQNNVHCLTTQNQWAYNNSTKTLYIYSTTEPSNVTTTYGDDVVYADNVNDLDLQNITIIGSARNSVYLQNSRLVNIENNKLLYSGMYGVLIDDSKYVSIATDTITDTNTDGIFTTFCNPLSITDNVIRKCEAIYGSARFIPNTAFGGQRGQGINILFSQNIECLYNRVSYCSYDGISLQLSSNFLIQYNRIDSTMKFRADGGSIYLFNLLTNPTWLQTFLGAKYFTRTGGSILNNIISSSNYSGIYMDESTSTCEVAYNYITGCDRQLYSHYSLNNNYHDNTIFNNNSDPGFYINNGQSGDTINNFHANLIVNALSSPSCIWVSEAASKNRKEYFSNNKYYYPFGKSAQALFYIMGVTGAGGDYLTLAEWKADDTRKNWSRSTETEITPSLYAGSSKPTLNFLIALTNPAKTIRTVTAAELPYSDYLDMDGNLQTYPFTMLPYTSKILVRPN